MDTKIIYIIPALIILIGCASVQKSAKQYSSIQYLKNYALCTCIADGFESKEVIKDAAAGARGYLEFGDLPLDAYTQATLLGRDFLKREYKSMTGQKLVLMKCIDFYNSKELNELAKRFKNKKE
jgi:hypothetical protein